MSSEAAFFDLDKTLLPGSSLFPLARELYRQRFFDLGDIARMAFDQLAFRVLGRKAGVETERYTGGLDGPLCHGEEKARRVVELASARGIDLARSFAYSDSVNDLPMLELVGTPVAMNPDRRLLWIARRHGWQ